MITENFDQFFNKKYTYKDSVRSNIIDILMRENKISEKDFKRLDELMEYVDKTL